MVLQVSNESYNDFIELSQEVNESNLCEVKSLKNCLKKLDNNLNFLV